MSQRQGDTGCVGGQLSHQSPCASVALARRARRGQHAPKCKRLDSSLSPSKSRRRRRTLHHHLHACAECTRDRWQHSCHAMPCPWIASADTSLHSPRSFHLCVCLFANASPSLPVVASDPPPAVRHYSLTVVRRPWSCPAHHGCCCSCSLRIVSLGSLIVVVLLG